MFNIGIVGLSKKQPPFKLTPRELPWQSVTGALQAWCQFVGYNKSFTYRASSGAQINPPGEWASSANPENASLFEWRFTHVAGTVPISPAMDSWINAESNIGLYWNFPSGGRVLCELRRISTGEVLISSHIWSPGFAP